MTQKLLFLDLEETLIESWDDPRLCKPAKVSGLLEKHFGKDRDITPASLWSFAVWHQADVDHFNKHFRDFLQNTFSISFGDHILTMQEMCENSRQFKGWSHLDATEFSQLFGKDVSLEHWAKMKDIRDSEIILLDDTVENKSIRFHDRNLTLTFERV